MDKPDKNTFTTSLCHHSPYNYIWELDFPPSDDTITGMYSTWRILRYRISRTCILSPGFNLVPNLHFNYQPDYVVKKKKNYFFRTCPKTSDTSQFFLKLADRGHPLPVRTCPHVFISSLIQWRNAASKILIMLQHDIKKYNKDTCVIINIWYRNMNPAGYFCQ